METAIVKSWQVGGKTYYSLREAKRALVELSAVAKLREVLAYSIKSSLTRCGNIDNVLVELLAESDTVRQILTEYSKKSGKRKKEVAT
jgi:hypothetical protein